MAPWKNGKTLTASEEETQLLARRFGESLEGPTVILLYGDLGAGKTTFTRGLVTGLGVEDPAVVRSPTFTLVNVYRGRLAVYHVDLYRVDRLRDLETIGVADLLAEDAFVVVEWAEKLPSWVQGDRVWKISITDLGGDRREIEFSRPRPEPAGVPAGPDAG